MRDKVKTEYRRPQLTHALGFCQECDFEADIFHDGREKFMRHIRKTGHRMVIETGYHQHYILEVSNER